MHSCVLGVGVFLHARMHTHAVKQKSDFIRWISVPANY